MESTVGMPGSVEEKHGGDGQIDQPRALSTE
jgi:hypothetical protein